MSVYIKGMEMPASCWDCTLESYCTKWLHPLGGGKEKRHPDCPLIPFDVTEFYDERSCRQYEEEFFSSLAGAVLRDKNFKRIEIKADDYECAEDAYYIFIVDANKAKVMFAHLYDLTGVEQPQCEFSNGDILVYEGEGWDGAWVNISERVKADSQTLKKILEEVSKIAEQKVE